MKKYKPKIEYTYEKSNKLSFFSHKPKHNIRQTPEANHLLPGLSFPWGMYGGSALNRNDPQGILISSSCVSL